MPVTYRTAGAWGAGKGSNLTPAEVDGNFYQLAQDILAAIAGMETPNGIADITVSGSQMTITLDDATVLGPFTIPRIPFRPAIVSTVAGSTYTPVIGDANGYKRCTDSLGCVVTFPADASVDFPIDTEITFVQAAGGAVSFDAPTDVTLEPIPGFLHETAQQGAKVTWKKIAADHWEPTGWLAVDVTA